MAILAALDASDYKRANALISQMEQLRGFRRAEEGSGTNVTVVKSALQLLGLLSAVRRTSR